MQQVTARIFKPGKETYEGTAWLCSRDYALTAAHCVGDRINRVQTPGTFTLAFLDFELKAKVRSWSPELDAALLEVTEGKERIPEEVLVKLGHLPAERPWKVGPGGYGWESWGFASGNNVATTLWGYIDNPDAYYSDDPNDRDARLRRPAIQLTCEQGGYDNLGGISGSAVSYNQCVIGLVRWGPPTFRQKIIFASPLSRIVESFDEVRELFNANLKREMNSVSPDALPQAGAVAAKEKAAAAEVGAAPTPRPPRLFGRERDVPELGRILKQEGARLLTLVGETGSGKTVLAQDAARELAGDYADGVYFVDLSLVREAGRVAAEVASALGVKEVAAVPKKGKAAAGSKEDEAAAGTREDEAAADSFKESLGVYIGDKQMLVILDGFEELEGARQLIEELLDACGRLQFVVTCRAALGWPRERVYEVGPLKTGASGGRAAEDAPAVELFRNRALRANPEYVYDPATLGEIEGVCETLGGLPLAIELAAALSATPGYGPALVHEKLKAAGGGAPGARLAALVELCYDSLKPGEKECLRRLAVFSGPVTPDAAEAVVTSAGSESRGEVREVLSRLYRLNLLHEEKPSPRGVRYRVPRLGSFTTRDQLAAADVRYRVPRPVRDFCTRQLEKAGEVATACRAHAVYYSQLTRTAERRLNLLTSAERADWLGLLEAEHEEIRAALKWCLAVDASAEVGLEIVGNLFWFWNLRDYLAEAGRWAGAVLDAADAAKKKAGGGQKQEETESYGKALYCAGGVAFMHGHYPAARALLEKGIGVWERLGNRRRRGYSQIILGMVALNQNELKEAREHLKGCVELFGEVDDRWGLALALNDLANVYLETAGGEEEARTNYQKSLALWRELDDRWGYALATSNLGNLFYRAGDHLTAKQHLVEASRLFRDEGNQWGWAESIKRFGHITFEEKDYPQAARRFYESMALHQKTGRKQLVADCLDGLARVAAALDQPLRSGHLFGAAEKIRDDIGSKLSAPQEELRGNEIEAAVTAAAMTGVTREEFEVYVGEGRNWTLEKAVAEATAYATEWRA